MTVKRINFTNRQRLKREHANIVIHPPARGETFATFEALLKLDHLRPGADGARVFVEAYHQATRMRFDFGTVDAITPPDADRLRLERFPEWQGVLFRVKVTDVTETPGKLLGWGNQIRPKGPDDQPESDLVLFMNAELGGPLWDIEFNDHGPIVRIETAAGSAFEVGKDERFIAAVYPEVLRRTLDQALIVEEVAHDDAEHWFCRWYEGFLKPRLGMTAPPPDAHGRRDWIEQAVNLFARQARIAGYWPSDHTPSQTGDN